MKEAARRIALVMLATALGLAAGEALVRGVAPQSLRPPWDDEVEGVRAPVPSVQGHHSVPGAFDVTVTFNAQRFRGAQAYAPVPPANGVRLAVLGDSLAFGWGAGDDETYPAQLERLLAARTQRPVEVINAGFPATCLGEKVRWFDVAVRPLRPALVILTVAGDDVDGDLYWRPFAIGADGAATPPPVTAARPARNTRRAFKAVPGYAFLVERSHLFGLVRRAVTRLASAERTTSLGQAPATPEETRRFREEGLPLAVAELRWLHRQVRAAGGRLVVVFAPFRESVRPVEGWWADEIRLKSRDLSAALATAAAAEAIPFLDATAPLRLRAETSPEALFFEGADTHPTPLGYRALAEEVARFLLETGALPAS